MAKSVLVISKGRAKYAASVWNDHLVGEDSFLCLGYPEPWRIASVALNVMLGQ